MSFITNAKVGTKLSIASGLGILLVTGMIINQQVSEYTATQATQVVAREQTILDGILQADAALGRMRIDIRDARLATTRDAVNDAMALLDTADQEGRKGLDTPISIAMKPKVLQDIQTALSNYRDASHEIADYILKNMTNGIVDTQELRKIHLDPAAKAANAAIDESKANAKRFTAEARAKADVSAIFASRLGLAIGLIIIAVLVASAIFLVLSIGRPVRSMTQAMRKLADGDTDARIDYVDRMDEIGEMAGADEIFRQAAIVNKRLEAEAEMSRARNEKDRIRLAAEADATAQARLQDATSGLAAGLRRLATGDLAFQLNVPFAAEFEALRHDLNTAVKQLAETLRVAAQTTGQIDMGTQEISQAAQDLSRRTEQQAASLEETAAALDQITANVTNSSKRADEARTVAVQANASATQSGKVVADAVDAMGRIEQSSNQISNIIGVIDEIAFQTNLLALNAGVEAARAGEAGKGFAVVAQEVRELAQRSAKAAKEIKELIRNSSSEVATGVRLVSETGEALKTIETYIVTVSQHVDAIATSSREQSVGLAEVNTAVNQMDQVTQQNAAMVEESTAASATLASQASHLRELIGRFQLNGGVSDVVGSQVAGLRDAAAAMGSSQRPSLRTRA